MFERNLLISSLIARSSVKKAVVALLSCIALFGSLAFAIATSRNFRAERQHYSAQIRKTYNLRFGPEEPFLPSNAQTESGEFIQPGAFPTAAYCGHCHAGVYEQWRQSLHSNSFREPFYKKNVDLLTSTKGIEFSRHCEACHNPIALVSGALTQNSPVDRHFDDDGITCSTCHSIQKLTAPIGTGSYVMGVPAVIVDEKGVPIPGEVSDKEILAHPDRHSKAVMKDFYKSPEFCGACHLADIPRQLNDYKWLRGFSTYDEYQNSSFSKSTPLSYYQRAQTSCQDCHMAREAVPGTPISRLAGSQIEYAAKGGSIASHRWLGGNTAVPFYYGYTEQLRKTTEFLQNKNLNVDIFALKNPNSQELIAPLGLQSFRVEPDTDAQVFVVIQNKGIGHSLIPEQRDMYEAWVEFTVKDASGREISHSGFLKPNGNLDERAHSFTNRLVGADGNLLVQHEIWNRRAVAFDNTIQSGRSALVRYQFHIPADAKTPLSITARVNYRHFMQSFTDFILGPGQPPYPVVEMAAQTRSINLGENQTAAPGEDENSEWMRWNNFGIALLDQQQFTDAIQAFNNVLKLRPDYADGYTNLAIANLGWNKFSLAHDFADKALQLSPGNARVLYYRALIERNQSELPAAIADLEQVAKQFPQSRDAHRELGVSYFLANNNQFALREFQKTQNIAPDDLLCHYYLAIVYRRLGMSAKADEQAARYTDKRDDPSLPTVVLGFLRAYPEASNEGMGMGVHVHLDEQKTPGGSQVKR
jgi:tetratricopeptide (TPR) repeat protein